MLRFLDKYNSIDSDKHLVSLVVDNRIYLFEYAVLLDALITRKAFYLIPELELKLSSSKITEFIETGDLEKTFIQKILEKETNPNLDLKIKKYIYL